MKRPLWMHAARALALGLLLVGSSGVNAASLGALRVQSHIGQPLRATIALTGDDTGDHVSNCIKAQLLSSDAAFVAAPLARLARIGAAGQIQLSTRDSINEPALTLTVEVVCGTPFQRTYQILLDPVSFLPSIAPSKAAPAPAKLTVLPQTTMPSAPAPAEVERKPRVATKSRTPAAQPAPQQESAAPAQRAEPAPKKERKSRSTLVLSPNSLSTVEITLDDRLKLSDQLSESGNPENLGSADAWRTAQERFAAMINDENYIENAHLRTQAAQAELQKLQQSAALLAQQEQATQAARNAIRKEYIPSNWITALSILVIALMLAIAWLASRLYSAQKRQASAAWANYMEAENPQTESAETLQTVSETDLLTLADDANTLGFDTFDDAHEDDPAAPVPTPATRAPDSSVASGTAFTPPVAPTPATPAQTTPKPAARAAAEPAPTVEPKKSATDLSDLRSSLPPLERSTTNTLFYDHAAFNRTDSPRTLKVEEISDVMQQAEFWMLLHDPMHAIEILEPYRDVAQPDSPVPWLYLLDLYRSVGDQANYEILIARIKKIFNAKIPKWDGQFGITPRSLNDFPHIVETICDLWDSEKILPYLEDLLVDNREGEREGFDLPVYRNIVQLITLAREPEHSPQQDRLRFEKAQAILFSQPAAKTTPDMVAPPSKPSVAPAVKRSDKPLPPPIFPDIALPPAAAPAAPIADVPAQSIAPTGPVPNSPAASAPPPIAAPAETVPPSADLGEPLYTPPLAPKPVTKRATIADMEHKLELALAYQDIGEKDGARELLHEVISDGSKTQAARAQKLLSAMS